MRIRLPAVFLLVLLAAPAAAEGKSLDFSNWVFWYHSNRDWIDPPQTLTPAVEQQTDEILATLDWARSFSNTRHEAIQGAAYVALGKLARTDATVEALVQGLSQTPSDVRAWEGAVLGLGLLRRTDPSRRFGGAALDRVRLQLFAVLESPDYPRRTRALAAISIGLLGDQPTGSSTTTTARTTTVRLSEFLRTDHGVPDLDVGPLIALSLQPTDSFREADLATLRIAASRGRLFERPIPDSVQAHAVLTLGSVGTAEDRALLQRLIVNRRAGRNVRRSAVVGLGRLGARVDAEAREDIVLGLVRAVREKRLRDASSRQFALMSIARLLAVDAGGGDAKRAMRSKGLRLLLETSDDGHYLERPYAALGLALVVRALPTPPPGEDAKHVAWIRERALTALRAGVVSKKLAWRGRASFALASGLAGDKQAGPVLETFVTGDKMPDEARAYAALGLGYLKARQERVVRGIVRAQALRRSEELRIGSLCALALLGAPEGIGIALDELRNARGMSVKGEAAVALGRLQDEGSIDALIEIVRNPREQDLTRMIAVSALGRIADPEPRPSLHLVTGHTNYRNSGDLMAQLFGKL